MKSILGIQFRLDPAVVRNEQESVVRQADGALSFSFVSALDASAPWETPESLLAGHDAVLLGGSGDFDFDGGRSVDDPVRAQSRKFLETLAPLFEYIFEHDIPTLGICYGHQIIGAWRGAEVLHDPAQHKIGTHTVTIEEHIAGHPLFASVPKAIEAQYGHKDVLDRVPEGAVLLAHGGERCQVSALRYGDNIFTTQFHPELTDEDMHARLSANTQYLPEGSCVDDIIAPSPYATQVLRNFFSLVASR